MIVDVSKHQIKSKKVKPLEGIAPVAAVTSAGANSMYDLSFASVLRLNTRIIKENLQAPGGSCTLDLCLIVKIRDFNNPQIPDLPYQGNAIATMLQGHLNFRV